MRNPSSSSSSSSVPTLKKSETGRDGGGKVIGLKRGPWTAEEDELLTKCINKEGEGKWRTLPMRAGLARCGKSCRLRWMNYLRPCVKRGHIAPDEEDLIFRLHRLLGNRWSLIAGRIPGRTDNEIKNYWNTHLTKKLISQGIDPKTHKPLLETSSTATYTTNPPVVASKDGKQSDSNNSGTSKVVTTNGTTPTSSGQNPNMHLPQFNSGSMANGFEMEAKMVHGGFGSANEAHEAGCYSDGYHQYHQTSNIDTEYGVGGYHVNLQERSSQGLSNKDDGIVGGGAGISCDGMVEDDGVFSSFLNSLINDDMFV